MASITIRNLDDSVKEALRRRAAGNRRSMEEEARLLLKTALLQDRSEMGLGSRLHAIAMEVGGWDLEIPPRSEMPRRPPFMDDDEPWP